MSSIGKSSSSSGSGAMRAVAQRLIAHTKTKASATTVLDVLNDAGLIKPIDAEDSAATLKRSFRNASVDQGKIKTPYGPLIQSLEINAAKCKHWEYINPFAWLYYVSTISAAFVQMRGWLSIHSKALRAG